MLALAVGSLSIHVACAGAYYQPEVPEKMSKYKLNLKIENEKLEEEI